MNTHLKQLWAAMKLPKNFKKSYKFFCLGLDIRVAKHMIIPGRNIQGKLEPPETVLQCSGFHWFTAPGQDIVFRFCA